MGAITKALAGVLNKIPIHALTDPNEVPVRIPARLVLSDELDYEPLRFRIVALNSGELPKWLRINADTGELQVSELPAFARWRKGSVRACSCTLQRFTTSSNKGFENGQ